MQNLKYRQENNLNLKNNNISNSQNSSCSDDSYYHFLISTLYWRTYHISNNYYIELLRALKDLQDPAVLSRKVSFIRNKKVVPWPKLWWKKAEEEWKVVKKQGLNWTAPGMSDYPDYLLPYDWCPKLITWKGPNLWLDRTNNLSIVGSRRPHGEVNQWLDSEFLKFYENNKKLVIVSGGARGIDQKAHAIALRSGRQTVCLLPTGLLNPYPSEIARLERHYAATNSSLVSLFSPHEQIYKSHFYLRNRLIVGFSRATFVASAEIRSGSMMTAKHSMEMGHDVLALPGFPGTQGLDGNLQLLYDGAIMIRSEKDLQDYWGSSL